MTEKSERAVGHMTPDEFRRRGREVIDWIADYMERLADFPVASRVSPGDVLRALPESPPERPDDWKDVLADLDRVVLPALTHWQSPRFFGYFPSNASGPAILGDLVAAGLGVNGMLWSTSPACTEVEVRVLDWLSGMIGLPDRFRSTNGVGGGVIQGTASEASLVAMLAAREAALRAGAAPGSLTAFASSQAHSSITKAAMISGLGREAVRQIEVDQRTFAMKPESLAEAIRADRQAGRRPFFVCATLGTTSSCAMDPLRAIAETARREGLWTHVDSAFAGAMLVCPEHRGMIDGVELVDSFNFNPHKWLLVNFDCSALWVADRRRLLDALSISPEYLRNAASETGGVIDYRDWQIPLGRRFRALKLWFVIRHYGVQGLREHVRGHLRLAELLEGLVRADERFEMVAPRTSGLLCFRLREGDVASRKLLERVNESGRALLTHTILPAEKGGVYTIRAALGSPGVSETDIRELWRLLQSGADEVLTQAR